MDAIRFSVVVPVFDNADDLDLCLASLRALRYDPERFEIIVVDNNSTDASADVARKHGALCLAEREHQSSYAARNRGIERARGSFVAFTDSDCRVHPDWLGAIERAAEGDAATGCFAGEILSVEPTTTIERFSDEIGLLRQKGPLSGWHFKPYAQTANAVYRRAVFDRIGLFDPTMKSGGDAAIAWRMQDETGFGLRFVPDAVVYHHHRTNVADLWSQFRRYGGGKMSWALSQKGYEPPSIERLESEIVTALDRHLEDLNAMDASERSTVFPLLRIATQMAHLSGYLQDRRRFDDVGATVGTSHDPVRRSAPRCDICGSWDFVPGPNGRMAGGRPPQCGECGGLERHRAIHTVLREIAANSHRLAYRTIGGTGAWACLSRSGLSVDLTRRGFDPADDTIRLALFCDPAPSTPDDPRFSRLLAALGEMKPDEVLVAAATEAATASAELVRTMLPNATVAERRIDDAPTHRAVTVLLIGDPVQIESLRAATSASRQGERS